jgi:predicted nucleic acid-binding protein
MKETVYLETSVVSYYTGRPSRDVVVLAHQEITRQWWNKALDEYEIFISQAVIDEASVGDPGASEERLKAIKDFLHLEINSKVGEMTDIYIAKLKIPPKAVGDAVHIAIASIHEVDYLVTWNCAHIANGAIIKKLTEINTDYGVHTPVLCTPEELLE